MSNATTTLSCHVRDSYGTNFNTRWSQGNGTVISRAYWGNHPNSAWVEVVCGGIASRHYGSRPA